MRFVFVHGANCDSESNSWKKWFQANFDKTVIYRENHELEFIDLPWSQFESLHSPVSIQEVPTQRFQIRAGEPRRLKF